MNAGPTQEPIDPVRFISNHSSGKMGLAIARAAMEYGASVRLVLGPVNLDIPENISKVIKVTSAASMAEATLSESANSDIVILTAAVADFTPEQTSLEKIKKKGGELVLRLKPTTDIAALICKSKKKHQVVAGFALETNDEIKNAIGKLKRKNLDLIVLNSLRDDGAGFGYDTNRITIIDSNNNIDKFELKSKEEAARDILDKIVSIVREKKV